MQKTFWKVVSISLLTVGFGWFLVFGISIYYWPNIPSKPRPSEGRIYALNNHGFYTYMNRKEHLLSETAFWVFAACMAAAYTIKHFVDPFDEKRRIQPLRPPPPWRQME